MTNRRESSTDANSAPVHVDNSADGTDARRDQVLRRMLKTPPKPKVAETETNELIEIVVPPELARELFKVNVQWAEALKELGSQVQWLPAPPCKTGKRRRVIAHTEEEFDSLLKSQAASARTRRTSGTPQA